MEPAVCIELRARMADISANITELTDMLTGDVRTDASLRRRIGSLKGSLTKLKKTAQDSGCEVP